MNGELRKGKFTKLVRGDACTEKQVPHRPLSRAIRNDKLIGACELGVFGFVQHALAEDFVGAGLVAFAGLF